MMWFFWLHFILGGSYVMFKIYTKFTTKWNNSYTCLVGKTAIVTGANSGIGYITALDFAKRGARVILACRNRDKAEYTQRLITKGTGNQNVVYKLFDACSLQSVRNFAKNINETEDRLDILVNNAGIGFMARELTSDGIQTILHVNHITPFLLSHLLMDKLEKSGASRIINVASNMARSADLTVSNFDEINDVPNGNKLLRDSKLYNNSKLCNILFTMELAKRLSNSSVTVNALHPGTIKTKFLDKQEPGIIKMVLSFIAARFFLKPEEGAQTQIYLSVSKDVEGVTGKLFSNCSEIQIYKTAQDSELARKVWEKSEELAKLAENEKLRIKKLYT